MTSRLRAAILLGLVLAGCGHSTRSMGPLAPTDTQLGECQREADDDPEVKKLRLENFYVYADPIHDQKLKVARLNATNACLRARGLTVPGGVEPVIHGGYLF